MILFFMIMFPGCSRPDWGLANGARIGTSRAYTLLGEMFVKHRGRIKPLGTAAIDDVRLIHGRPTITTSDPGGERTWEPVAAVLDWSARPGFWDERDFILVESRPLQRLLSGSDGTSPRLSPRRLEDAQIRQGDRTIPFDRWADELRDRRDRARSGKKADEELSPIESAAVAVGERLRRYRALRDHDGPTVGPLDLMPVPRPSHKIYQDYMARAFTKGMDPNRALSPLEADAANTLAEYLERLPERDWALPGEDATFDQVFTVWLGSESAWLPLGVVLGCDDAELAVAGLPPDRVATLRGAYRRLEAAERATPGEAPEAAAADVVAAARALGEDFVAYPPADALAGEVELNRLAPFSKALMTEGLALACLLLGLVVAGPRWRAIFYGLGLISHTAAIGFGAYGLLLRFRVSRHLPVSTGYETALWAALAASAMGLAFQILRRKGYPALAASVVAVLGLSLAGDAMSFDPDLIADLPPSRVNRWLAGHAAVIVTGYGALAFAMGLGLLATILELSAPLRLMPTYRKLARPVFLGLPIYILGRGDVTSAFGFPRADVVNAWLAVTGGMLALAGSFALLGELASRSRRAAVVLGVVAATLGTSAGVAVLDDAWWFVLLGVVSLAMGLLPPWESRTAPSSEDLAAAIDLATRAGVLLVVAGMVVGVAWARRAWDESWLQEPKAAWTIITLLIYLIPIVGRLSGRMGPSGVIVASVVGFAILLMTWFVIGTMIRPGRHDYGLPYGADVTILTASAIAMISAVGASSWRRMQVGPSR